MVSRAMQEVANRAVTSQSSDTVVPTTALKAVLKEGENAIEAFVEQVSSLQREVVVLTDKLGASRDAVNKLKMQLSAAKAEAKQKR